MRERVPLFEEYRLIEKCETEINGAWKGWYRILIKITSVQITVDRMRCLESYYLYDSRHIGSMTYPFSDYPYEKKRVLVCTYNTHIKCVFKNLINASLMCWRL